MQEETINCNPGAGGLTGVKLGAGSNSTLDTVISLERDILTNNKISMPRRPSMKKDKKENDSLNSTTSSVSVRFDIRGEQTEM